MKLYTDEQIHETKELLSQEAVDDLRGLDDEVVRIVVGQIRTLVDYWESRGLALDPIQFATITTPIVITLRVHAQAFSAIVRKDEL